MFNVGDMVKSNKLGIGTVVKSGRIFSTVNFNGKNKLVSNGSLTKYEEEPKKTEIKQEDIKGEQLSLFGAEADILEESNEEKEQEEIAEIITAANDSKVIKEEKKADIKQEKKEETKTVDVPVSNDEVKQKKPYTTIGKEFNKAINQNLWVKIKYKNKDGQETSFMVGPKDINPNTRFITVDSFNISYSVDVSERNILFNSILSAEAMEGTYHKTPDALINKIASNPEYYSFLLYEVSDEKVLDYYTECFKLDNVSYKTEYGLLREIDDNVLLENNEYKLTNEQFIILSKALFNRRENKKKRKSQGYNEEPFLAINKLSIKTKKGLYVLAYRELKLDVSKKILVADSNTIINKEFAFDSNTNDSKNIMSISKFIPEESMYLVDDFDKNEEEIHKIINSYNKIADKKYGNNLIDSRPYMINLCKNLVIDIERQFNGIRKMFAEENNISAPIKTFFGNPEAKGLRKMTYPIYVVNDKYNIDQINAINVAIKSPVSYIQGPPGTGKTQTLLNMILTAEYNGKTALVTSNNNIPMDSVYESICELEYKPGIPLLFPAIRLGNSDAINRAFDKIKSMMSQVKKLEVNDQALENIKAERREALKGLVSLLDMYEEYSELKSKRDSLEILIQKTNEEALRINFNAQLSDINERLGEIGEISVTDEELRKQMNIDYRRLFMSIHFDTAARIKRLNRNKYKSIYDIIVMDDSTDELKQKRTKKFKEFLTEDENLSLFQEIFPIIITTNLSCCYLGSPSVHFNYVMMDEAGQCNIANALVPIVRGERLVLVGDPQQLRPVIVLDENVNAILMKKYNISDSYDYIHNSIYTAFTSIDIVNTETLLSYHYRCNDKIIEFSNRKYYNNKLKLHSKSKEEEPLLLIDTSEKDKISHLGEKNMSSVEAEIVCQYCKQYSPEDVAVITPFVHQKECIEDTLSRNGIKGVDVGTVHAFQGDQKKVVIFSTAITKTTHQSTYNWLKNNRELINVAVSRPIDKLIMLTSKDAVKNLSSSKDDLSELVNYVETNGKCEVTNVSPKSEALGTRQINTRSEQDFIETLEQLISVLNNNCYVLTEVSPASIFKLSKNMKPWFYNQRFDFAIFEKTYNGNNLLAIVELNGPEHSSDPNVIQRDNYKKELCKEHNVKLFNIPRECARDYYVIKNTLKDSLKK